MRSPDILAIALSGALLVAPGSLAAFEIGFDWGALELCTSGRPNVVANPIFALKNVPEGTKVIEFKMLDHDAPGYNHGGGLVPYQGQHMIEPGAFNYKSPCPPNGRHLYEWQATALDGANGKVLGTAKAQAKYP